MVVEVWRTQALRVGGLSLQRAYPRSSAEGVHEMLEGSVLRAKVPGGVSTDTYSASLC